MTAVSAPPPPRRRITRDASVEARVSPLELFFDLVFVFAITQVTAFMAEDLSFAQLGRGLIVLALVWWSWGGYAWLTNAVDPDVTLNRVVMFSAMAAMLVLALAVPDAFSDDGAVFALAYLGVRLLHALLFWAAAAGDAALRRNVVRLIATALIGPALILIASLAFDGTARDLVWLGAVVVDYGIVVAAPASGWHVSPGHFAERFGLIVIIALGESIVALGVGAAALDVDVALVVAGALTMAIVAMLWWTYFDVLAEVAEHRFRAAPPDEQPQIARDVYGLLHLPLIAGIVFFALGVKKATEHLGDPLKDPAAFALCGGLALYALAPAAWGLRGVGAWSRLRVLVAVASLAVIPLAASAAALWSLALLALVWVGLTVYESVGISRPS